MRAGRRRAGVETVGLASPCINVCRMEAASGLCAGCLRTLDEIAAWATASDEQKRRILAAVARRRARRTGEPVADDSGA